jgi:hypothetical protein
LSQRKERNAADEERNAADDKRNAADKRAVADVGERNPDLRHPRPSAKWRL